MPATTEPSALAKRIAAEFDAHARAKQESEQQQARSASERAQRLRLFDEVCDRLRAVWGPRLEEFAFQFGDKIKVTPKVEPSRREARLVFMTSLANITLSLSVSANHDVTALVLDYDLLILPMIFKYERHAVLEVPLDRVDADAIGKWLDDRLVNAVKAYFTVLDNEFYLSRGMAEDPITKERFLSDDAAGSLVHKGETHFFATAESMRQYKAQNEIRD
jgi:hypothetical protein